MKHLTALLILFLLLTMGCAGHDVLSWRDPMHNIELSDRTEVYADQDVAVGNRVYKGLYAKVLWDNGCQYKFIANRRQHIPMDITLEMKEKRMFVVGAFQILYDTKVDKICDKSGLWCSGNINQFKNVGYANPRIDVEMRIYSTSTGKLEQTLEGSYNYRSMGPYKYGDILCIPIVGDVGVGINWNGTGKGGINVQVNQPFWYELEFTYFDPDNGRGRAIKSWTVTVNKP